MLKSNLMILFLLPLIIVAKIGFTNGDEPMCKSFLEQTVRSMGASAQKAALTRLQQVPQECLQNAFNESCGVASTMAGEVRSTVSDAAFCKRPAVRSAMRRCPGIVVLAVAGNAGLSIIDRCKKPSGRPAERE